MMGADCCLDILDDIADAAHRHQLLRGGSKVRPVATSFIQQMQWKVMSINFAVKSGSKTYRNFYIFCQSGPSGSNQLCRDSAGIIYLIQSWNVVLGVGFPIEATWNLRPLSRLVIMTNRYCNTLYCFHGSPAHSRYDQG